MQQESHTTYTESDSKKLGKHVDLGLLDVRVPQTIFSHKKNLASLIYDSSEARTGAGGITSNIHVNT